MNWQVLFYHFSREDPHFQAIAKVRDESASDEGRRLPSRKSDCFLLKWSGTMK